MRATFFLTAIAAARGMPGLCRALSPALQKPDATLGLAISPYGRRHQAHLSLPHPSLSCSDAARHASCVRRRRARRVHASTRRRPSSPRPRPRGRRTPAYTAASPSLRRPGALPRRAARDRRAGAPPTTSRAPEALQHHLATPACCPASQRPQAHVDAPAEPNRPRQRRVHDYILDHIHR